MCQNSTEDKEGNKNLSTQDESKKDLIKKYKFSDYDVFLLMIIDDFFKLVDDRKKNMMKASYYQIQFLKELEKRTNIPLKKSSLYYSAWVLWYIILKNMITRY